MKYKVGEEVLIKARVVASEDDLHFAKTEKCKFSFAFRDEDVVPAPDMTAEEAWKILSKILLYPTNGGFNSTELEEIFGRTEHLWELTPQEAKAKIEAWEAEKEIKVGDVVIRCGESCIVTNKSKDDGFYDVLFVDGTIGAYQRSSLKKTGRHIDIVGILKQIGGDE